MKKGTHSLFPCMLGMVILCVIFTGCTLARIKEPLTMIGTYFDTVIQLQVWDADEEILEHCKNLCRKYENLFSAEVESSDIGRINQAEGKPVSVSSETAELIQLGIHYGELSDGKFDITVLSASELWDFHDGKKVIPDQKVLEEAVSHIDYKNIQVDGTTVTMKDPKCRIDLGGIAKGYIADRLKEYLEKESGVVLNDNAIFDIQIKRLHEYKRQQMNVLYIIYKYLDIKAGNKPKRPITMIFGAKAAPAYIIAKDIIHVILCLQELIKNDPEVSPYLQVVMVENYNVTMAEKLIPACEVSEQISLASKEASGTGNMKFMLNGAVTLGTEDGANVEIHQLVGDENIYIFGESSDQVIEHYAKSDYVAADYYINDADIRKWVDFIISPEMLKIGDVRTLLEIHAELIQKDWFMTLLDVKDYVQTKERVFADYEDRMSWAKKMIVNIAKAGFFSSDRTIAEYNRDIWHL